MLTSDLPFSAFSHKLDMNLNYLFIKKGSLPDIKTPQIIDTVAKVIDSTVVSDSTQKTNDTLISTNGT